MDTAIMYNFSDLTDQQLKLVYLVTNDLSHKSNLANSDGPLKYQNPPKGVSRDEQTAILDRMVKAMVISLSINEKYIYLNEYKNSKFSEFFKQLHSEYHKRFPEKTDKKALLPHYDELNGVLYIKGYSVKIRRQDKDTYENQILKHIFIEHKDNIAQEFDYNNIPLNLEERFEQKEKIWSRCRTACLAINKKIAETSKNKVTDFLQFNSRKYGSLKINPEYLNS